MSAFTNLPKRDAGVVDCFVGSIILQSLQSASSSEDTKELQIDH